MKLWMDVMRDLESVMDDHERILDAWAEGGVDGVVMDLRNNGGGALHEANDLVGLFIDKGPTVQIRNANNDVQVLNDEDPTVVYDGPLVVLTNRMSASASEIFAGAIQDYGRGLVVGRIDLHLADADDAMQQSVRLDAYRMARFVARIGLFVRQRAIDRIR